MKLDPTAYVFSPAEAEAERREAMHLARTTPLHYGNRPGTNRKRRPKKQAGDVYDVAAYRRAIARGCDLAFTPPDELLAPDKSGDLAKWRSERRWHPHQLRHSAATEIRKRFGIEGAQHVLGHQSLAITEVYAERDIAAARQVAAAIG
jgi:integrase